MKFSSEIENFTPEISSAWTEISRDKSGLLFFNLWSLRVPSLALAI